MALHTCRRLEGTAAHHGGDSLETGRSLLLERHLDLAPGLFAPEAAARWEAGGRKRQKLAMLSGHRRTKRHQGDTPSP